MTNNGRIAETMDGFAVNIRDCNGEPGKCVNTIDDQKTKKLDALINPIN